MLKDQQWTTFLFGLATVTLPCGQSLIVFSACALTGSFYVGLFNGFALALLTTPALFLAMQAHTLLKKIKHYYRQAFGISAFMIGGLAICRGLAEMEWIPHFAFNSHFVLF
jgi:sulfite exporter TauE/SafE